MARMHRSSSPASTTVSKRGRPTKYQAVFIERLLEFFDVEPYREVERKTQDRKSGREYIDYVDHAADLPTFERFAHKIGVNGDTLVEWASATWPEGHANEGKLKHPDFSAAYMRAKDLQKDILVTNGLQGLYPSNFAIFVATNFTSMSQKHEVDHTTKGQPMPLLGGTVELPHEEDSDEEPAD